jgi:hypothetical protein
MIGKNFLPFETGRSIIIGHSQLSGKSNSNSLANQLGKNKNLAKLTSPRAYMRVRIVVAIVVSL